MVHRVTEPPTGRSKPMPTSVSLTADQYAQLVRFVPQRHHSLRLRDLGDGYVQAELMDRDGTVSKSILLFPEEAKPITRRALDRLLREQGAKSETPTDSDQPRTAANPAPRLSFASSRVARAGSRRRTLVIGGRSTPGGSSCTARASSPRRSW